MKKKLAVSVTSIVALLIVCATLAVDAQEDLQVSKINVDGVEREFLIHVPASAKEQATPVVFAFHGHGGSMQNAARSFAIHQHWPEAISLYMQGVPTPGRITDPEGKKTGWQADSADFGGRDLNLFDAVLAQLRSDYEVDTQRIYCTGHSNGGGFTYLLWATRSDVFAAVAPSSAVPARSFGKRVWLKPKPAMHIAGENDPLVKYQWQAVTMKAVHESNGCEVEGKAWHEHPNCLIYESASGTPFVSVIHPGGHKFYQDAAPLIVAFFKEH